MHSQEQRELASLQMLDGGQDLGEVALLFAPSDLSRNSCPHFFLHIASTILATKDLHLLM